MITFGYKTRLSSICRALASIGVGLVMTFGTDAPATVVKIIACFIFAAGIVSLACGFMKRQDGSIQLMAVNAVVDCIIGLLLFLNPEWVAGFIVTLIGIALVIFGALQLIVLSTAMSLIGAGFASLILSAVAILGGIFLVFSPFSVRLMSILAGVFLLVYGVSELLSMWRISKAKEEYEIRYASDITSAGTSSHEDDSIVPDAKEVEFHKIDEQ